MGFVPLNNLPSTSLVTSVNMISTLSYNTLDKGKSSSDSTSYSHFEETYQVIQSTSDPTINDNILVHSTLITYHIG